MRQQPPPHERFLRSLRLRPCLCDVLKRLNQGDRLEHLQTPQARGRAFLRSMDLEKRVSTELHLDTVKALVARGLVYPDTDDAGEYVYKLTEEGELAGRLLWQGERDCELTSAVIGGFETRDPRPADRYVV